MISNFTSKILVQEFFTKKRNLIIILLLTFFLIIRVFSSISFGVYDEKEMMLGDHWGYSEFAVQINTGTNWFFIEKEFPGKHREPVYPFFVALIYFIFGLKNFFAVYFFQSILSVLMTFFIYRISLLLFDKSIVAYISLIWSGFYFVFIHYSGHLLRETLIFFLIVILFYWILKIVQKNIFSIKDILIISFLYTILIHTDGRYVFYGPFLFIIFFKYIKNFFLSIKKFVLFTLFVIVFTIPWTIRNYFAYNEIIIISEMTINLTGKEMSTRGEHFVFNDIDSLYNTPAFNCNEDYPSEEERRQIKSGINIKNRTKEEVEIIKKDVYPAKTYLGRKLYFIECLWVPFDFSYNYKPFPWANFETPFSLKHNILSILFYGSLIPFFFYGIVILIKNKNKYWFIVFLPIVVHFLLHFLTFGLERYRHPIDAFIIILGTFGIYSTFTKFSKRIKSAQ